MAKKISNIDSNGLPKPSKLTDWSKEPSVRDLVADLEAAKPSQQTIVNKITGWEHLRNATGPEAPKASKGRSKVQPKLVRRQAEWRYSALSEPFLGSDKIFSVKPRTFEDTKSANLNEIVLNYQMDNVINKVKFFDDYVHSCVDDGTVIVRVGWERRSHEEKEIVPIFSYLDISDNEELMQELQEAVQLKMENPNGFNDLPEETIAAVEYFLETGIPVNAVIIGEEEIEVTKIDENKPVLRIVNPKNLYIDPSCEGDILQARYIINSFETSKYDLEQAGVYKNLKSINWEGASVLNNPDHYTNTPSDFQFKDNPRKRVVAHEYWGYYDVKGDGKLVCILATWIGDVLIRLEESPFPDERPPFVVVPYLPVKREVFGESDAELLGENQRILGAVTRGMIDLMGRSANSQIGFAKGFLDPLNRKRYEDGDDYEFNTNTPPDIGAFQQKYPEIPRSALEMVNLMNADAESLTGVKSFSGGMSGNAYGDIAAGIRGMLDAAGKREMSILRRLAQGIKEIGVKIIAMNSVFLSDEEFIRITNEEFVRIRREDLKGNFDLIVDIATNEVDNLKAQDLAFMLQTMGPSMDFNMSKIILSEIARLKRMPDLAKAIERFEPKPDPMEERLKELAIEEAMLKNEELKSKIRLNDAKARQAMSDADIKDLDFVETETGTKHARDMERMSQQAEAQSNQAITKGIIELAKQRGEPTDETIEKAIGYNGLAKLLNNSDPRERNLGSQYFDPSQDPALNPRLNF